MLKETIKYLQFTIEKHVGGAQNVYRAIDSDGNTVTTCTNLAYLKKELRGMK
jgi:hypothetical protein